MAYYHDSGSYDCSEDEGSEATCSYALMNTASGWEVVQVVETWHIQHYQGESPSYFLKYFS